MTAAILIARLIIGLGVAAHGSQKLFGWFGGGGVSGTAAYMESLGYRPGTLYALASGFGELLGGLLVAVGVLNGIGPALVILVMLVAILTVHLPNGYFNANKGWELPAANIAAALAFDYSGFGKYSLDRVIDFPFYSTQIRWVLIGAAIVLALLTYATRHRRAQQPTPSA